MSTFKHLLVPTDFSHAAGHALDLAVSIAEKFEADVTLFHAYTVPIAYTYEDVILWPADQLRTAAEDELDAAVRRVRERFPRITSRLSSGSPSELIVEHARATPTDLIVMGTHGRRGVSRVLLGSVAEKIVRLSPVPVLTTSGPQDHERTRKHQAHGVTADDRE